ncbi:MAG: ABC transporter permease [Candidatus Nanopelagicales bacterium]|nr:ABC transporter permease [Candidatus Nanopelagicales bacterium]MDZ4250616.1 ABC transporter permease [Candidatus Nanopelagicales bacterium]
MKFLDYIRMVNASLVQHKLRTGLTVLAVVIGSVAVISVLAAIITVRTVFEQQLEASGALTRIIVSNESRMNEGPGGGGPQAIPPGQQGQEAVRLTPKLAARIAALPHVTAVSPALRVYPIQSIRLKDGDGKQYAIENITAIEANAAGTMPVAIGRFVKPGEMRAIVLSSGYAESFGLGANPRELIGQKVILKGKPGEPLGTRPPPTKSGEPVDYDENQVVEVTATVVGIAGGGPGDGSESFVSLEWGTALMTRYFCKFEEPRKGQDPNDFDESGEKQCTFVGENSIAREGYSVIGVNVDSVANVAGVASEIQEMGVFTQTAQDMLSAITTVLTIVGSILGGIGAVSLLVATIGIVNTMIMATYERRREIGVMRATGASRRTVLTLFTLEAGMIGFWGGVIGLGFAMVVRLLGNAALNAELSGQGLAEGNYISFPIWLIVGVIAGTTSLGILAGVLPAARAARADPVDALASGG